MSKSEKKTTNREPLFQGWEPNGEHPVLHRDLTSYDDGLNNRFVSREDLDETLQGLRGEVQSGFDTMKEWVATSFLPSIGDDEPEPGKYVLDRRYAPRAELAQMFEAIKNAAPAEALVSRKDFDEAMTGLKTELAGTYVTQTALEERWATLAETFVSKEAFAEFEQRFNDEMGQVRKAVKAIGDAHQGLVEDHGKLTKRVGTIEKKHTGTRWLGAGATAIGLAGMTLALVYGINNGDATETLSSTVTSHYTEVNEKIQKAQSTADQAIADISSVSARADQAIAAVGQLDKETDSALASIRAEMAKAEDLKAVAAKVDTKIGRSELAKTLEKATGQVKSVSDRIGALEDALVEVVCPEGGGRCEVIVTTAMKAKERNAEFVSR